MVVVGGCSDWSRLKIVASGLSSPSLLPLSPSLGISTGGTVFDGGGLGVVLHLITCVILEDICLFPQNRYICRRTAIEGRGRGPVLLLFGLLWSSLVCQTNGLVFSSNST